MAKNVELLLTYALNEGDELVSIESITVRGLKCNCRCPKCKEDLVAKLGNGRRQPHFAHKKDSDCHGSYMTALHMLAEKILIDEKAVMAPEYKMIPSKRLTFDRMESETRVERKDLQPDVVGITEDGKRFHIEIKNTHAVDEYKKGKIIEDNITCLEIDVSNQKLENLKDFLLDSIDEREWINNYIYEEQLKENKRGRLIEQINNLDDLAFNQILKIKHFEKLYVSPDGLFQRLKGQTPKGTSYILNIGFGDSLDQYLEHIEEQFDSYELNVYVSPTGGESDVRWVKDYYNLPHNKKSRPLYKGEERPSPKNSPTKNKIATNTILENHGVDIAKVKSLDELFCSFRIDKNLNTEKYGLTYILEFQMLPKRQWIILLHYGNGITPYHVGRYYLENDEIVYKNIADFQTKDLALKRYNDLYLFNK